MLKLYSTAWIPKSNYSLILFDSVGPEVKMCTKFWALVVLIPANVEYCQWPTVLISKSQEYHPRFSFLSSFQYVKCMYIISELNRTKVVIEMKWILNVDWPFLKSDFFLIRVQIINLLNKKWTILYESQYSNSWQSKRLVTFYFNLRSPWKHGRHSPMYFLMEHTKVKTS